MLLRVSKAGELSLRLLEGPTWSSSIYKFSRFYKHLQGPSKFTSVLTIFLAIGGAWNRPFISAYVLHRKFYIQYQPYDHDFASTKKAEIQPCNNV